jgi:DNA polymerase-3 subunit alpha
MGHLKPFENHPRSMKKHVDFVHLHVHTQYSLLDGANPISSLLGQAAQMRMPALAVTDHGNLFGAVEFYQKAHAAGVKPIIGCEMYVAPKSRFDKEPSGPHNEYNHLILLARDNTGYKNLLKLVSAAHLEGFYYKPRIDKELLSQHAEGLIGLSACLRGEVPQLIAKERFDEARAAAGEHTEILGRENFYLELQDNKLEEQIKVNNGLIQLGKKMDLPLAATNDCHYLRRADSKAHDILLCLQTGKTVTDPNRMRFGTDEHYFKSYDEMLAGFGELPQALLNTKIIAERCNLDLQFNKVRLPQYQVPPEFTREQYLETLARRGLEERFKESAGPAIPREYYLKRFEKELAIINSMGYAGYFLIVWDIVNFARSKNIPVGPGRGSAAGSLVAYALRITDIDPLRYGLLFERFLNPERITMPDIDMDFCMDGREAVIRHVTEKFGSDHVSQIITFGTLEARAVIRDVGRVLEFPYADVDRLAKLVPNTLGIKLDEAITTEPRLAEAVKQDPKVQELVEMARSLEGLSRHASTHAAGIVISDEPLTDHAPLYRGTKGETVTQFPMGDLEKIGLVKFDLLGLRTLTVIDLAVKLVNKGRAGASFRISEIPIDDKETYELLGDGRTIGVFQLESSGMRDLLFKLKPEQFEDLIALLALYRPGPIQSGMVDDFIKRKRGKVPIKYELPQLEEVLKDTYGVIVYQEQVMKIANVLAGFSMGQADILRRAMGKKKPEEMEKQKTLFINGAKANHIPQKKAEKIFDLMAYFAGYGFNKSHSAAYALITYQTAYLKAHYPTEFMAALLSCVMGNSDKVVLYINECRDLEIKILPPDVNESRKDFTVVEDGIRFGLAAIKNVGEGAIESIRSARAEGGPFRSLFDFCRRVDLRKVNKRTIEGLIKSGAFDSIPGHRAQQMAALEKAMQDAAIFQRDRLQGQEGLFSMDPADSPFGDETETLPAFSEWDEAQRLRLEKESLGFYITSHPLARYQEEIRKYATVTLDGIHEVDDGKEIRLFGIIAGQRVVTTKRGDKMAYLRMEDLHGTIEVLVFPDLYKKVSAYLSLDTPFLLTGQVDRGEKGVKIKATDLESLDKHRERATDRVDIHLESDGLTGEDLESLKEILMRHPGPCPVFLRLRMPNRVEPTLAIDDRIRIQPTDLFISDIEQTFGKGSVVLH